MPFDQQEFEVEVLRPFGPSGRTAEAPTANPIDGDPVLRILRDTCREMMATSGGQCIWNAIAGVSEEAGQVNNRLTAVIYVARELYMPCTLHNWQMALPSIYLFNDTHELDDRVAIVHRAIASRRSHLAGV